MQKAPQALGGLARAASLDPEARSAIAREAAKARWNTAPVKAVFGSADRPIKIADIEVPCFILEDGRRVITTNGLLDAFKMARGGSMKKGMNRFELFASRDWIKGHISESLAARLESPVKFRVGRSTFDGFDSDTLIDLAEAVVRAADAGTIQPQQMIIAHQCLVITQSLTRLGLIALIDEATGYQERRESDELQKILSAYILPEHRPWMKTIPDEFTSEVYRVFNWDRRPDNRGPRYAGKLIRKLIYEQLPDPVLPELDAVNPSNQRYQRARKHFQHLTEKQGLEHFRSQVIAMMTILRISRDKLEFWRNFERYHGKQLEFRFDEGE